MLPTAIKQFQPYFTLLCITIASSTVAQDDVAAALSGITAVAEPASGRIYTPVDFERFAPRNALDMLNQVPGFSLQRGDQGRGFGQADTNVLVNSRRLSSKSQSASDQLRRVAAINVERIELIDGATMGIPGLSGQVANVITSGSSFSGSYEYFTVHRPRYAEPGWLGGEVSISGTTPKIEWNAAYSQGTGRGAAAGPSIITDRFSQITEVRDVHSHFEGDFPSISGNLKWFGPGSVIANLNMEISRSQREFSSDEDRNLVTGVDRFRDLDDQGRGNGFEIGGDVEFTLGPGQLKIIGLESFRDDDFRSDSTLIFADGSTATGNRFARQFESSERIVRSEYSWDMLGGDWQIDTEAAYNKLDQSSQLFRLDSLGNYAQIDLANSAGEVTEDRYEMIITHGRTLVRDISIQIGIGGEKSELAQTGPNGLTRNFWRPKGSLSLAWTPREGLDLSLNVSRKVDQLSFGQFLANVDLQNQNANAGNAELRPTLSWETNLQIQQNLGDWGSTTIDLFTNRFDDYIDIIPLPGGGESQGNIDSATLHGIDWTSTINLDPIGWAGVRVDLDVTLEKSSINDPLTGERRSFSGQFDREYDVSFRHDISGSDWAWGLGMEYNHVQPSFRLSQVSENYEGPIFSYGFIEHKNFFGMTASLNVFNLTDGRAIFERTVYEGLRNSSEVLFNEAQDLSIQPIFRFELAGNF
ncbi:MAG: TonB-dependent receptor plug domain-containing protein [Pseudohongiellaceae bacterium]